MKKRNKTFAPNQIPSAAFFLGNLLSAIERKRLSMRSVCRLANVSPALVCQWKRGAVEPKLSSLQRLERAFIELVEANA